MNYFITRRTLLLTSSIAEKASERKSSINSVKIEFEAVQTYASVVDFVKWKMRNFPQKLGFDIT